MPMIRTSLSRLALAVLAAAAPLLFAGCASKLPLAPASPGMFDDAHFGPPTDPIDPADVFKLTPEMTAYMSDVIMPMAHARGVRQAITEALYNRSKLQLEYDASSTRTAAEAFQARQGNCLSLVIMTGAFASALDLKVTFQQVSTEQMWSRSGGMYFMSGHVNLLLEKRYSESIGRYDRNDLYTIDFMPGEGNEMRSHPISQQTVLAMFMNNRAAEAMVRGQLDDAYWRARQAIRLDPEFRSAYNTLGVIYMRHGDAGHAEKVLRYVLDGSPDNPRILANYGEALRLLGRTTEAQAVQARLAVLEPVPPFFWFVQGQAALHKGDFTKAREMFLKEIARDPDYHEFHYALAVADFGLNRLDEARAELALAMTDAVKRSDHDLYAAKLDKLKAWQPSSTPASLVQ
ncbi:MAG: tetratricopeptide repeat protein [Burkholderiaceae bacterium]|jgi:Tfp pilus assembly protein PilF